jgi:hypothetical protein
MKHFLDILTDVRIAGGEIAGTLGLLFLIAYGVRKAWQDFIVKPFKKSARKTRPRLSRTEGSR